MTAVPRTAHRAVGETGEPDGERSAGGRPDGERADGARAEPRGGWADWPRRVPTDPRTYLLPLAFVLVAGVLLAVYQNLLSARAQASLDLWASTNLDNLHSHPVGAMVASALVMDGHPWQNLLLTALSLYAAVLRFGTWRTLAITGAGQVFGTIVSEEILGVRIASGGLPEQLRHVLDIGPSYVMVAALGAVAVRGGPGRWAMRGICALGLALMGPTLFGGLGVLDFTAIGHTTALLFGVGASWALPARGARPGRVPGARAVLTSRRRFLPAWGRAAEDTG
ncbi:hypothetical protein BIV57_10110 [Mangrovactinospora gilvigrisea]|uniref:Peptidase S54 rhomboid domain-containing protein n=1 Tax=Mangrovactinospora gilvigrisea TaxID=1428644 RepID=A0A1J7BGA5_9ACTN|nr:rhomboid-like protein [Mangrovactinospora gilvigrisea]OIV37605.1 hypothetical protein BIV57_10110 [Mangrovactinospora gilvigrisea]